MGGATDKSIAELIQKFDWGKSSLGDPASWPLALQNVFKLCIKSKFPILIIWGAEMIQLYNDAYAEILGSMHPEAFGSKTKENWVLYWKEFGPLLEQVLREEKSFNLQNQHIFIERKGYAESCYFTFSYSPLYDGVNVVGIFVTAIEITGQVTAHKKIEESEMRQRLAIEAADIGTFDRNMKESTFEYSDKLAHMFGYPDPAGLHHEDFTSRIHPEDLEKREGAHQQAFKTGTLSYEMRIRWNDGSEHWLRFRGKVFYDIDGTPSRIYGTALDITEQLVQENKLEKLLVEQTSALKDRSDSLKKSEERYYKMIEEVQDYAIILLDENGIILNWNRGAEKIKQYTEKEIVGRSFKIFYLPSDQASKLPEKLINEAIENGRASHEGWRLRKDQTRFWGSVTITALHDAHNSVIGFSKVTRDLTERKISDDKINLVLEELEKKNEELIKSEERYHKMISEVQDYAIILLNTKGEIENWNAGAQSIKGYRPEEVIGKNFRVFYPAKDLKDGLPERLLNEATENGKAIHEGWRVRKDGTNFWGSVVITALHGKSGELIGYSKVTRDLTQRKAAEDKLIQYAHELELQNSELEQFAYVASHDLQEPLRKIQTFSDLIREKINDINLVKVYNNKVDSSAKRMSALIKSILNYSHLNKERIELTDVDLDVILQNVIADLELMIHERGAKIAVDHLPRVTGDAIQLEQLFSNLLNNALKFSVEHPVINIKTKVVDRSQVIENSQFPEHKKFIEISFEDNGIGFSQEYEAQIFKMFQRLHPKNEYSGTGIGLALCKKIVLNHNGYIRASGSLGKGATFVVYLPVRSRSGQ